MTTSKGLLDTSVFIAGEDGRPLERDRLPAEFTVCVITLAELRAGVLAARDTLTRARRMATYERVSRLAPLPIDAATAAAWADLRVVLAENGRRAGVNDLWIAAVAIANRLPVYTQDADFQPLAGIVDLEVVRV